MPPLCDRGLGVQVGFHPGQQQAQLKGFGDVVVEARRQATAHPFACEKEPEFSGLY